MKTTQNYSLKKPDYSDTADIAIINENMDIIDKNLKQVTTATNSAMQKTTADKYYAPLSHKHNVADINDLFDIENNVLFKDCDISTQISDSNLLNVIETITKNSKKVAERQTQEQSNGDFIETIKIYNSSGSKVDKTYTITTKGIDTNNLTTTIR